MYDEFDIRKHIERISWFVGGKNIFKYYLPDKAQIFWITSGGSVIVPMRISKDKIEEYEKYWDGSYNSYKEVFTLRGYSKPWLINGVSYCPCKAIGDMISKELSKITKAKFEYSSELSDVPRGNFLFKTSDPDFGEKYINVRGNIESVCWRLPDDRCIGIVGFSSMYGNSFYNNKLENIQTRKYSGSKPEMKVLRDMIAGCKSWDEAKNRALKAYVYSKQQLLNKMSEFFGVQTTGTKQFTLADLL